MSDTSEPSDGFSVVSQSGILTSPFMGLVEFPL